MIIKTITVTAHKSMRKNAKHNNYEFKIYLTEYDNVKDKFNDNDIMDLNQWLDIQRNHFNYNYFTIRYDIFNGERLEQSPRSAYFGSIHLTNMFEDIASDMNKGEI